MNFIELVRKSEQIIYANGLEVDRNFRDSYFLRSGMQSTAAPVAVKGAELLLKVVSEGINSNFDKQRRSIIKQLSVYIVKLTELDNSKVKKIRDIESGIDALVGEADWISRKSGTTALDLGELINYCKETKESLEILLNTKIGDHEHFRSADVKKHVEQLLVKLDEVIEALGSGELHDLSSKAAGEYYNMIYDVIEAVRARTLNGYIITDTLRAIERVQEMLTKWKQLSEAPDKNERISEKERKNYIHKRSVSDDSISTICGFMTANEEFLIFASDLEAQEKRVEEGEHEIEEEHNKINERIRQIDELEQAKRQAAREYKNDGNVDKFNRAIENSNRQIETFRRDIVYWSESVKENRNRIDLEGELVHDVREKLYNGVLELSRTPYLFCKIAERISWPVISGVLNGSVSESELTRFQAALAEVEASKATYLEEISKAVVKAEQVEKAINGIRATRTSESNVTKAKIILEEQGKVKTDKVNRAELSEEAKQILSEISDEEADATEKEGENKTGAVLPGLSKNDR